MINLNHVYKTYSNGCHALRDISVQIEKGEFIFLTGPSGAGKTTLFRLLSCYDHASSGVVQVAGSDLARLRPAQVPYFRRRIGVVYQDFRLLKNLSVFENVALPLRVRGERVPQIKNRVQELLDHVGLWGKQKDYPDTLSGGEQQRVAIARAVIHQPGLLIADEPTGNLDELLSDEIMNLFETVNAQGTTVFVATHNMELVERRARRLLRIQSGCLVGDTRL